MEVAHAGHHRGINVARPQAAIAASGVARELPKAQDAPAESAPKDHVSLTTRAEQQDTSAAAQMKSLQSMSLAKGGASASVAPTLSSVLLNPIGSLVDAGKSAMDKVQSYRDNLARERIETTTARNTETDTLRGDQLATMQEGDRKTLGGKGGGHIRGLGNDQEMQFEMEKRDGKYYVSRSAGSTVFYQKGDGKGGAGVKVKEEYAFDSPRDAARAERVLSEQTQDAMKRELRAEYPGERELKTEDGKFLNANRSSLTITGAGGAEYARKLGITAKGDDEMNLGQGAVRGNQEMEIKVNYQKQSEGPAKAREIEVSSSTGVELEAELQPGGKNENLGGINSKMPGGKGSGKVTVTRSMPVPEGFEARDILENPERVKEQLVEMNAAATTKITAQAGYDLLGKKGRVYTGEFQPTGDPEKDAALARAILRGDVDNLRKEPTQGKLTVKSQDYEKTGVQTGWGFDFKVIGYDGTFENTETRVTRNETLIDNKMVDIPRME